jgi:hypothetical protein
VNREFKECGNQNSETRRIYEERFLAQLQSEPVWKCQDDPTKHPYWREIQHKLKMMDWRDRAMP